MILAIIYGIIATLLSAYFLPVVLMFCFPYLDEVKGVDGIPLAIAIWLFAAVVGFFVAKHYLKAAKSNESR
jgi:hypothetical protein